MLELVEAEYDGLGFELPEGRHTRFNGMDILQTQQYIKVGCWSYLSRVLKTHGWDRPLSNESTPHRLIPIPESSQNKELQSLEGPAEGSGEAKQLAIKHGFGYRQLLGELIYAYVIARLDIGFSTCLTARFSHWSSTETGPD